MFTSPEGVQTQQIAMGFNPTMMMLPQQINQNQTQPKVSEAEQQAYEFMKKSPSISIEREESCIQIYWDFRNATYKSQIGKHSIKRFQPLLCNLIFCWPLKMCCTTHQIPRFVENDGKVINMPNITISGVNCGFISVGGQVLGTYDLKIPSICAQCCCGTKPEVIITKESTKETFTFKAEEHCIKNLVECLCPCLSLSKKMEISKGGDGLYSRSFFQAIFNCLTLNNTFYNKLDVTFGTFVQSDVDKLLIYGAFIFYQEHTNRFRGCPC